MSERLTVATEFLDTGTLLADRYEIVKLIGSGGMASVYLAHDQQLDGKEIALKVLHKEYSRDKTYVERFLQEVKLMGKVHHPNVIETFDVGGEGGLIYFTMEYVHAESLEHILESREVSTGEIAHWTIEICRGLQAVHNEGIMHRDLKPGNILVCDSGTVKIADFGIAREKYSRLTAKNQKVGSICFIAPEVWLGKSPTPAVDYYSLGIVLFELATGDVPFEHGYPGEVMRMHLEGKVTPPIEKDPKVPRWLNDLIMELLEKNPKKRLQDPDLIIERLQNYSFEGGVVAAPSDGVQVFPSVTLGHAKKRSPRKTYVMNLSATRVIEESQTALPNVQPRRMATLVIPLPNSAAFVFEIERPSRDFLYFGLFFASLQVADGVLTSMGMNRFGTAAEGNPLLRNLMEHLTADQALVLVKVLAVMVVVYITVLAKKIKWIKDIIGVLSCIYLFAAIIPWVYILFLAKAGS